MLERAGSASSSRRHDAAAARCVAGAVFDLDGTLTDNMAFHQRAFDAFLARHGLPPLTHELRRRLDGKRNRDIFPILFGRALDDAAQIAYAGEKEALYRELSSGRLAPLPGLSELLAALARRGVPAAVATSAPRENVDHTLCELGLERAFAAVARADDVAHGKPHPDVFLLAAKRLGVAPGRCVAFEDAPVGIEAAHRAGMTCVALTTTFASEVSPERAAHVVRDYAEFLAGRGVRSRTPRTAADRPRRRGGLLPQQPRRRRQRRELLPATSASLTGRSAKVPAAVGVEEDARGAEPVGDAAHARGDLPGVLDVGRARVRGAEPTCARRQLRERLERAGAVGRVLEHNARACAGSSASAGRRGRRGGPPPSCSSCRGRRAAR